MGGNLAVTNTVAESTFIGGALGTGWIGVIKSNGLKYIGNAPNFMVYAMARDAGVKMPGFFGYMLWSSAILLPLFVVVGWMFFAR